MKIWKKTNLTSQVGKLLMIPKKINELEIKFFIVQ
jgi:hypothetical protein